MKEKTVSFREQVNQEMEAEKLVLFPWGTKRETETIQLLYIQ